MSVTPLTSEQAYTPCDLNRFSFETTEQIEPLDAIVGQERALEAIEFGATMQQEGFNLFAMGPTGSGKYSAVMAYLGSRSAQGDTPSDCCYVNNFSDPRKPLAVYLSAGQGRTFKHDIAGLVEMLKNGLPAVFESNEYRNARELINQKYLQRQEEVFLFLQEEAAKRNIYMKNSDSGRVTFAPIIEGKPITPEEFSALEPDEKQRINDNMGAFETSVKEGLSKVSALNKSMQEEFKALDRHTTSDTVDALIYELIKRYGDNPTIVAYLEAFQDDVIEHVHDFLVKPEEAGMYALMSAYSGPSFRRYEVNLFVEHDPKEGSPVVFEDNPNYQNLIGRIEHVSQIGTLVTDFSMLKPGALHRANGGYLVLDARKLLMQPFAWEELKRVLRSKELRMESLAQQYSFVSTVTLEPEPIPANIKVVLIGERMLYYMLHHYDPDFKELFKVVADFEDELSRTDENLDLYGRLIGTIAQNNGLLPLNRSAVARVIEQLSRDVDNAQKLSTHLRTLSDLLKEADHFARKSDAVLIDAGDIESAIEAQKRRSDRLQLKIYEQIEEGTIMISCRGTVVGQVNGLSVLSLGGYVFGMPSRITARTRLGKGEVINIERSVELSGPIHSKGVLILAAYLGARYASDRPLALSATLAFEQSYGKIDGDSASSAELYALLSSLSGLPLRQDLAVTGSVNQFGEVQAIGGVNEKIEGFFDVCRAIDSDGIHGVLIPSSNVKNLMLKREVREAMERGRFHIYPIRTIDEGISILTGTPAGDEDENGAFPEGSVNARVAARVASLGEALQRFNRRTAPDGNGKPSDA